MKTCVEIAEFKMQEGRDIKEFLTIIDGLEKEFHSLQEGFMKTQLLQGKEKESFIMIQHWETKELAMKASKAMMKSEKTEAFRESLDPTSVKLRYNELIDTWQ